MGARKHHEVIIWSLALGSGVWLLGPFLPSLGWALCLGLGVCGLARKPQVLGEFSARGALGLSLGCFLFLALPVCWAWMQSAQELARLLALASEQARLGLPAPGAIKALSEWVPEAPGAWIRGMGQGGWVWERISAIGASPGVLELTRSNFTELAGRSGLVCFLLFFCLRSGAGWAERGRLVAEELGGTRLGAALGAALLTARAAVLSFIILGGGCALLLLGLYQIAGASHPVALALGTTLCSLIPFLAPFIVALVSLWLFGQGGFWGPLALLVIGCAAQLGCNHFARPWLVGRASRIPFLWSLLAMLGGLSWMGWQGVIWGPALLASIRSWMLRAPPEG